jgi:hypothetical protein
MALLRGEVKRSDLGNREADTDWLVLVPPDPAAAPK